MKVELPAFSLSLPHRKKENIKFNNGLNGEKYITVCFLPRASPLSTYSNLTDPQKKTST